MNNFYDIAPEGRKPNSSFQLKNLGPKRNMVSYGIPKRNDYRKTTYSNHALDRDTKASDYDSVFANMICKTDPPYAIELFLSHHYQRFLDAGYGGQKEFFRHIKYVVIPLVECNKKHRVYVALINEWLDENKDPQKTGDQALNLTIGNTVIETKPKTKELKTEKTMDEAFISYSWDNEAHEQKVVELNEHLRKKGYDSKIDKMISQQETATNFVMMMHLAILNHQKIIVVLSAGYKKKAETFTGGVGEEYRLLLSDITRNPKKYILVSFLGRYDDIIPFGLMDREIIDLSLPDGLESLYRKLSGTDKYVFSDVGAEKPNLESVHIGDFKAFDPAKVIQIENPAIRVDSSRSQGGVYKEIEFKAVFAFKNISGKTVDGFAYEIKVKRELIMNSYYEVVQDGYYIISDSISTKLFPNATAKTQTIDIKLTSHSIYQVLGTVIAVSVHTDHGTHAREFPVEELFKVLPPSQSWGEPGPLTQELFT